MDLIIRIPASRLKHFRDDKRAAPIAFWRFHNRPRGLNEGDYLWFTRPEGVIAGARIIEINERDEFVDTLDRVGNFNAIWNGENTFLFDPPILGIQYAQQGYRYATLPEQRRLRRLFKRRT